MAGRPQFHFTAPVGWINDPHGITFRDGRYHHFYQYLPDRLEWGSHCHWAHAVSPDLIRFEHRPIAIAPGEGDHGIWTGCLVDDGQNPRIYYTAVSEGALDDGRVRIATPTGSSWDVWEKGDVVVETPTDPQIAAFRDPFVMREGNRWRMCVGASSAEGDAVVLTYVSADGISWVDDGVTLSNKDYRDVGVETGSMWECPQFFPIGDEHALVTSVMDRGRLLHTIYALGEMHEGAFHPRAWGQLSYGSSYYAPSFYRDEQGRPCLLFWMREVKDLDQGWIGAHSVPYTLQLESGGLTVRPGEALLAYRGEKAETQAIEGLAADVEWAPGSRLEIRSGGQLAAAIGIAGDTLTLQRGSEEWSMPWSGSGIRVIADGPVLEVVSAAGVIGCPIDPAGDSLEFSCDAGELSVWPLRRSDA